MPPRKIHPHAAPPTSTAASAQSPPLTTTPADSTSAADPTASETRPAHSETSFVNAEGEVAFRANRSSVKYSNPVPEDHDRDEFNGGLDAKAPESMALLASATTAGVLLAPSIDLVAKAHLNMQLFGVVKNNDGEGTQRLLEKGADVNVADAFKITPLMIAAEKGYEELCAMLLAHGANVDHMDGTERTALGVAALNNHAAVVKLLIRAGADAVLAVACLTNVLQGIKEPQLRFLLRDDVLCSSPDPIRLCFRLCYRLNQIKARQEERQLFYQEMHDHCQRLAVELLSRCESLWDVRRLLAPGTGLLGLALKLNQYEFVAHPFAQTYLKEMWHGTYAAVYGWAVIVAVIKYFLAPVLLPYYALLYALQPGPRSMRFSRFGELLLVCNTPFFKFIGHTASFLAYLVLLIIVISGDSNVVPTRAEMVLGLWLIALILQEIREFSGTSWKIYRASFWNALDFVVLIDLTVVMALRLIAWLDDARSSSEQEDLVYIANQLLALGAILSCVRILAALEIHQFLGPLQFSIRQLLQDLFRFLVLLLVIVFAFAAGLTKIYEATPDTADNHDALIAFGSLERSLRTTFWALFGLVDFEKLAVTGYRATSIQVLGEVVFGVYLVLVVILLLNLLIALLNRSYELIAGNSDLVWKFARARLIREFDMYPLVPAPLNLVTEPLHLVLARVGFDLKQANKVANAFSSSDAAEEEEQLNKLYLQLAERYLRDKKDKSEERDEEEKSETQEMWEELLSVKRLVRELLDRMDKVVAQK